VALHRRAGNVFRYRACNAGGCSDPSPGRSVGSLARAVGVFKASNSEADDQFGLGIALSADGRTLVAGARGEDSGVGGVDADPLDNSTPFAGAAYVYRLVDEVWTFEAYLKASNPGVLDEFGRSLTLSDDGSTLAVGALMEDSADAGVGGDGDDDTLADSGAVYVFERDGASWRQAAYLKASTPGEGDWFGSAVELSGDGMTLAVGALGEDSGDGGVDADELDDDARNSGAVYVFSREPEGWRQQAFVKPPIPQTGVPGSGPDTFGGALTLSEDGDTLAVGARGEDSSATGVDGDDADESARDSGAVYVFDRDADDVWSQAAYLKPSNTSARDVFGSSIAISQDGETLAVSAPNESGSTAGVGGEDDDDSLPASGAIYVFERTGGGWSQSAYIKSPTPRMAAQFAGALDLSGDGRLLAAGDVSDTSSAAGVGGDRTMGDLRFSGAVQLYVREGTGPWEIGPYVKAPAPAMSDSFGAHVALARDGDTLAVSTTGEDSDGQGVHPDVDNDDASMSGIVFLY